MQIKALVTAVVRQMSTLMAELATAAGGRAPLADVPDQLFLELARELELRGVGKKVAADMFGLALRSYQKKLLRLAESPAAGGHSLWEAVLGYVRANQQRNRGPVRRSDLLLRFRRDDEALVRAVIADLIRNKILVPGGHRDDPTLQFPHEAPDGAAADATAGQDAIVWQAVYVYGPLPRSRLLALVPLEVDAIDQSLSRLTDAARIERQPGSDPTLSAAILTIDVDTGAGWEAAVFDHVQALVATLTARLRSLRAPNHATDAGGSTYTFDVWPGHPHEAVVRHLLARYRAELSELRVAVDEYNRQADAPAVADRITFYLGQNGRPLRRPETP